MKLNQINQIFFGIFYNILSIQMIFCVYSFKYSRHICNYRDFFLQETGINISTSPFSHLKTFVSRYFYHKLMSYNMSIELSKLLHDLDH